VWSCSESGSSPSSLLAHPCQICNSDVTCRGCGAGNVDQAREADGGPIWQALSDPTRRRILDVLCERPRVTGEIAGQFDISRIAVMRHLEVLSAPALVTSRKRGRERW